MHPIRMQLAALAQTFVDREQFTKVRRVRGEVRGKIAVAVLYHSRAVLLQSTTPPITRRVCVLLDDRGAQPAQNLRVAELHQRF